MAKSKTYELLVKIAGKEESSLKKACVAADKNLAALGKTASGMGKVVAGAALASATAVGTLGVAAVKAAAEYQAQLSNVSTLLTGTEAEIAARTSEISGEILDVSNRTGVATDNLTDGMYQVISAFGDSADAAKILETAAKSAAAGNATTTDSVNLLSAVTKGYGDTSAEAVQKAADLSFATVRLGQTSFPELAASMGKVVAMSSTMKVSQEEVFGAMATLTGVTGNTAEVATQLQGVIKGFLQPSDAMAKAIDNMGYKSGQAMLDALGLQGSLMALKNSVNGNDVAFSEFFGDVTAKTAVLSLAGSQAENFTSKTAEMYEATGAANAAFERQTDNLKYDIQMIKNLGANFLTQLGTNILPYVRDLAEAALPVVQTSLEHIGTCMTGTIIPSAKTAVTWIGRHKNLLLAIVAGVGTAVALYKSYRTALIAYNAAMAVYKVVTAASATGTFTLAGAVSALHLKAMAVCGVIGLMVAGGILFYKNWSALKTMAGELGAKISAVWTNIDTAVTAAISAISERFPLLGAVLSGVWTSIQNCWNNIQGIFSNIISFIDNVFSGNWSAAWENIVAIFGNVFGLIGNIAKIPMNAVVSAINWVLGKINSISVTIPDWVPNVGGTTLGFHFPMIPALAAGGVATAPTLAMIGEGGEPEAVLPLSKLAALLDEWSKKPKPSGGGHQGGGDTPIHFSPVFNFYGSVTKEDAVAAGRMSFAEFKRLYDRMKAEERRKKFSLA